MIDKSTSEGQHFVYAQNTHYIYDLTNAVCEIRIFLVVGYHNDTWLLMNF
jgi:hypothetical protein